MPLTVLGISAYYHDSAAALVMDGKIIAAAQEERFTRIRHDASFPRQAIKYVLEEAGISFDQISLIVFYEKPFIKFERLLETYHAFAPKGIGSFVTAIPVWLKEKLFMKKMLKEEFSALGKISCPIHFPEHHLSHAASAFFPSSFNEAAILTIDGVGEWATTAISRGKGNEIEVMEELHFPHSVGLLYSAFTYYTGFKVNSGEYKLMGLAPYGLPEDPQTICFIEKIKEHLVDIKPDGSILLNMAYFNFATGLKMVNEKKWKKLFEIDARKPEAEITQDYMNLAYAIQQVTEEVVVKLAATAKRLTGCNNLAMAGGVALNCVANSKILRSNLFENVWIQPASGDAGGALGSALAGWHISLNKERIAQPADGMEGSYLGPQSSEKEAKQMVNRYGAVAEIFEDFTNLTEKLATFIDEGKVIGWFQGRMEFGPRALGNRSILADARNPEMQQKLNLKIKGREGFRPFAPSVLEEDAAHYFNLSISSPYMMLVADVKEALRTSLPVNYDKLPMLQRLNFNRSSLAAITHVDYSARVQTVSRKTNPRFHELLSAFKKRTGCAVLVNTSFNVRGEPIVCTADDAYRCFMTTDMDYLVIENCLFDKRQQPPHLKGALAKAFKMD
jgi:carbamoyltransferase